MNPQHKALLDLAHAQMPYGKYKGRYLIDLPEYYVVWLQNNRLPSGTLGTQLRLVHELQVNGLEDLVRRLRTLSR